MNLIDEIINKLSPEEKAQLVCGSSFFGMAGVPSLNINGLRLLDGGTGMNYEQIIGDICNRLRASIEEGAGIEAFDFEEEKHVTDWYFDTDKLTEREKGLRALVQRELDVRFKHNTKLSRNAVYEVTNTCNKEGDMMSPACFPTGMMLGATWNEDVIYDVGRALGREARAHGIHLLLGTPNINIHRDPLNGRLFEGFSEDPRLVMELAPYLVMGVQDEGVAANVKHFAANNQETNRQGIDEIISERALYEIYLPGFKACVEKGKAATVMAAYNKINGTACTENEWLLTDMLRDKWGFEGVVISDWGAVYNQIPALKAGNDVNMPGPVDYKPIVDAIADGSLSEETLDNSVRRVLKLIFDYGMPDRYEDTCRYIMDMSAKAAYNAASEGIVMLKNERGIFPLINGGIDSSNSDSVFADAIASNDNTKVILCGSGATSLYDCGTGSAGITTDKTSDIYSSLLAQGVNVACDQFDESDWINGATYLCVARVAGMEGNDRADMNLSRDDREVLDRLVRIKRNNPAVKLGLILNVSGPCDISKWNDDLDGIFCIFLPGMEGGNAMADILTGRVNPSGKLPLTFPRRYEDTPSCINFPGDGRKVCYGEGIYVGYRYYDKKQIEPLYPFGHGLSYSTFEISNIRCNKDITQMAVVSDMGDIINIGIPVFSDEIKIYADIKNLGPASHGEGREVVQLYVSDVSSRISKPVKELKAFKKVRLNPGEAKTVEFALKKSDFESYDEDAKGWAAEEGVYEILIGTSSRQLVGSIKVYLDTKSIYSFGINTSIKRIYENRISRTHLYNLFDRLGLDRGRIERKYEYESSHTFDSLMRDVYGGDYAISEALLEFLDRIAAIKIL